MALRLLSVILASAVASTSASARELGEDHNQSVPVNLGAGGGGGDGRGGGAGGGGGGDFLTKLILSLDFNETRLLWPAVPWNAVGAGNASAANATLESVCDHAPLLVTRSLLPNGKCMDKLTEFNASCTCITLPNKASAEIEMEFRVSNKPISVNATSQLLPTSIDLQAGFPRSSVGALAAPVTLQKLTVIGEVEEEKNKLPLSISVGKGMWISGTGGGSGSKLSLLRSSASTPSPSSLSTVVIINVDLRNVTTVDGFFPVSVKNLTLRNCNIPGFSLPFMRNLDVLETLDLSSNGLIEPYERPQIVRCVTGICPLKSLDLSNNKFKTLPPTVSFYDALEQLDLSGNPITNISVSAEVFTRIAMLKSFRLSSSSSAAAATPGHAVVECPQSFTKKTAHNVELCVAEPESTTPIAAQATNTILIYGLIGGTALVAVLFFIIIRQRNGRSGGMPKDHHLQFPFTSTDGSAFDTSFYNSGTASLLNDPIIITRRIQQSDIRVGNCISKGGFGIVYSGVYRRRRRVAIKKIRPEYSTDTKMIETFLKEICLMATLRHARIVEFVGVAWESPRDICAVTEFMDKGDVRDVLQLQRDKNKAVVTWENARKTLIALHVAEALQYLHSLQPKVIHRDLKAKNVLLNAKFEAKLSDFGISRERHLEETHMTAAVGTSFWIAPEVLLGRQDYDECADIYSFGVLLCEIDTEDYPFWTENHPDRGILAKEHAILRQVASGTLRPQFSQTCPHEILAIAQRCLDVDPHNRPTANELVESLGSLLQMDTSRL